MNIRTKQFLSAITIYIALIGMVYATTIGPKGIGDSQWGNFTTAVKTPKLILNGVTRTTWPSGSGGNYSYNVITVFRDGANTVAQDRDGSIISNTSDAHTVITAALAQVDTNGGGTIRFLEGVYTINGIAHANLSIPSSEEYIFQGSGLCNSLASATTTGGSVLSFTNGARFVGGATGVGLILRDMVFSFTGTYTDSAISFIDNDWVSSYGCGYAFSGTVPNGNAANPSSTLTGNVVNIGKVAGPTGIPFEWINNRIYDNRQGASTSNCLLCFVAEGLIFNDNYFRIAPAATLTTPNLMFVSCVSGAELSFNQMYVGAWAGTYANQIMSTGANKNFYMRNNQFLDPTDITSAHIYTNSGTVYVEGSNPIEVEGGTSPMDISIGGAGTVYINFEGRGYEVWGSATISNGNTNVNVTHGLVGTPNGFSLTGSTDDTANLRVGNNNSTITQIITPDGAVGGDRTVYYHFTYSKSG